MDDPEEQRVRVRNGFVVEKACEVPCMGEIMSPTRSFWGIESGDQMFCSPCVSLDIFSEAIEIGRTFD